MTVRCDGCGLIEPPTHDWTIIDLVDGSTIAYCPSCTREPVEPVDDIRQPHAFRHPDHCARCNLDDPVRWVRRDPKAWNGRM